MGIYIIAKLLVYMLRCRKNDGGRYLVNVSYDGQCRWTGGIILRPSSNGQQTDEEEYQSDGDAC